MNDVIYKFLDKYVGDNYSLRSTPDNEFHSLYFDENSIILSFKINCWKKVTIFRFSGLCKVVSDFFSIDKKEAGDHIEKWFCEKHKLEKIEDVLNKNG